MPRPLDPPAAAASLNGHGYILRLSTRGPGQAFYGDHALTGDQGLAILVRDLDSGHYWPLGDGPADRAAGGDEVRFTSERDSLRAELAIALVPKTPAEIRRVTLTNLDRRTRRIDLTTFAEVVLAEPRAHAAHPAFANLFLQTEFVDQVAALLVRRRPRDPREHHPWLVHASLDGGAVEYETDRARFLGRGRPANRPAAMAVGAPLSATSGNVLDPCLSLRRAVTLAPGESAVVAFLLGAANDRAAALALACRGRGSAVPAGAPAPATATAPEADPVADPAAAPNGHGRFDADGREYVIQVRCRNDGSLVLPPRPWVNVIANETCGCVVSETGAGAAWYGNSREFRLTPWFNDPVRDPHGDAVYLRDDQNGAAWSCWPGPAPAPATYEVRHGFGYTSCRHAHDDLAVDTHLCVARNEPARLLRVSVRNAGARARRLSLWRHLRLVLGAAPAESAPTLTAWFDPTARVLLARNAAAGPWAGHVVCSSVAIAVPGAEITHATSVAAFLGPTGDLAAPAFAPLAAAPADTTGPDAGFTQRVTFDLAPGAAGEVVFVLGCGQDAGAARRLAAQFAQPSACEMAALAARTFWRDGLAGLRVETPVPALDVMVNGWLAYQTVSCRLWGRTALYQSGGAFGFRDQLQDALALLALWPQLARHQLLLHAAHQFREGDVLHWWHPPLSRGIRTRFADDLLWLPYLAAQYIAATGDRAILAETAPYLTARALAPGEDEAFVAPEPANESGDLYDHCCRAIDRSLAVGAHGLPLFGTGDWNDGMNRVGREGRGESVWMGFFLAAVIDAFVPLVEARGDRARAARYRRHREALAAALHEAGWDGAWYRRGYYDDGSPLGSHRDTECRIDALAQAWSVLSKVAPPERARQALDACETHLISEKEGLIRLLTPPFVDTPHDPGYIKGYVAGVRENGGQYTHAALWVVQAMAAARRRHRAAALLAMLSPVSHTATAAQVARYQVEPYVVAADVFGADPHVGRGGWTWYTGSAGWMLRVALESVLGLRTERGETLVIDPCVPDNWPAYRIRWRVPGDETVYAVEVTNPDGCAQTVVAARCDGAAASCDGGVVRVPLLRDGREHRLAVTLGRAREAKP
ncbi:MAG: glycosyl transferase [Candidatus Krumholzibacteria bacterium]|jgi:cyclic beta-1,2-glucan synthetase|nr:glycosyl transferase [Candidatus Krumholzibacteria bacterium]